ncbi:hypothetical protein AK830_g10888 [Neonectria ditissima]|uniref:Protein RTA1 n=1 Tax=Neonectria ditissima TaxID=78410 RepID=A0A0P7ASF4_9HYPO|nr:hypothetical protein AK830_g10888 [Neonectria ditissima]
MVELQPYKHGYYLWLYVPSLAAAVIFCLLFGVATIAHVWKICKTRTWFCIPFAIGGYMQFLGYAARAAAHSRTGKFMPYVIQNNNIVLAPVLYAASIYMVLGRVIRNVSGERYSLIRPTRLTKIFVTGDVFSLMIQGGGAGMSIVAKYAELAQRIIIAGLVIQIIIFGLFWATAGLFHRRMRRCGTLVKGDSSWESTLKVLYAMSALIMARSVFRVIEFSMGMKGYLLAHEWTMYIFDSVPMFIVMVIFWRWFPAKLKRPGSRGSMIPLANHDDHLSARGTLGDRFGVRG